MLDAALEALADDPELVAQTRRMPALCERYVPHGPFEVREGAIPFTTSVVPGMLYPVTLITEATDETIRGEAFRIAHEAQYRTVLAVAGALDTPAAPC